VVDFAIAAVIAAAGQSRRMGEPKQLLPWGASTVIGTVVGNLLAAGARPVICVTGHQHGPIGEALADLPVQLVYNAAYATSEMLTSYQLGLQALATTNCRGALLALGDQPHLGLAELQTIITQAQATPDQLVIPSHNNRRGHPIYLPRERWAELLALDESASLRTVIAQHSSEIVYVLVDTAAILRDMDTPAEYQALRADEGT